MIRVLWTIRHLRRVSLTLRREKKIIKQPQGSDAESLLTDCTLPKRFAVR